MWRNAALICLAENTASCVPWSWVCGGKAQDWGSLIILVVLLHNSPVFPILELHRPGLRTVFKIVVHLYVLQMGDVLSHCCFVSWGFPFFLAVFAAWDLGRFHKQLGAVPWLSVQPRLKVLTLCQRAQMHLDQSIPTCRGGSVRLQCG